jgi:hypothetical protein
VGIEANERKSKQYYMVKSNKTQMKNLHKKFVAKIINKVKKNSPEPKKRFF